MTEKTIVIKNRLGLHAKPAGMFVREASKYKASILVIKEGIEVNGKSIMGLLLLAAESGSKLTIKVDGPDEQKALEGLEALFTSRFGEE